MKKSKIISCISALALSLSMMSAIPVNAASNLIVSTKSSDNQIQLSWNTYTSSTKYYQIMVRKNGEWKSLGTVSSSTHSYTVKKDGYSNALVPGTTYKFAVRALNSNKERLTATTVEKSTQSYSFVSASKGAHVYTDTACTQTKTSGWNQSYGGLSMSLKLTGVYDEINNCYKVQLNYNNYYMKKNNVSIIASTGAKILPTGAISQLSDIKSSGSYSCGCGPTSIAILVKWEQNKNVTRNSVIADAKTLKVDTLGGGYGFNGGTCRGLKATGLTKLLKYESGTNVTQILTPGNVSDTITNLKNAINNNHRVIVAVSPARTWGHYVVVAGYYVKNGTTHFIVADPLYDKVLDNANMATNKYSYYSLVDYTADQLFAIMKNAKNCTTYGAYNASNIGYMWYLK